MKLNESFISEFTAYKAMHEDCHVSFRSFLELLKTQSVSFYGTITWELFTTFVFYAPSSDIFKSLLSGPNKNWPKLSEKQRQHILCALKSLDKRGDVSAVIKGCQGRKN